MDTGSKDMISILPDDLVCHILSFLSTKDAALTSILSRRWRHLLASVPSLDFVNVYNRREIRYQQWIQLRESFKVSVDRVMALQGNAPLNRFSLRCEIGSDPSYVNGWILRALERGVQELDLFIDSEYEYPLPPEVWMSKTLVSLKVAGTDDFTIDVRQVFLPKLKTLHFKDVEFDDESGDAFAKLISGCHALEELVMTKVMWDLWESCSVSNPTLKRVKIDCVNACEKNPKTVSFDTPNLVCLEFTDDVAVEYPKAKFGPLVEASIGLRMVSHTKLGNVADFLMGISNVKKLYLTFESLEVLNLCCKAIPVFNNLIHLTVETDEDVEWESLPILLKNCPNLETLVFEGLHYGATDQCLDDSYRFKDTNKCFQKGADWCLCKPWPGTPIWLSSSPVRILKVLKVSYYLSEMDKQKDLITYLVKTMPNLEQVILYFDTPYDEDVSILSTELQKLEKVASPKCKIEVISDNIAVSFTVHSSSTTNGLVFFKNTFPV